MYDIRVLSMVTRETKMHLKGIKENWKRRTKMKER